MLFEFLDHLANEVLGGRSSRRDAHAIFLSQPAIVDLGGSVNQMGEVQPIGGVNEKIEGFFRVCRAKGLTGDQGVLIPAANVEHLMLNKEVVEAVEASQFHIYPISTIEGGIELLTGIEAGSPDEEGAYPAETVFGRVMTRLEAIESALKAATKSDDEENGEASQVKRDTENEDANNDSPESNPS